MELFTRKIGPVFLKEDSDAQVFIEKLEKLKEQADDALKKELEKQLRLAKYGLLGEQNVAFELKSSGLDMYVLHDIYLEYGDLSAQIDYLVITRKHVYVIECKNLTGSIEIDNSGNFIRRYDFSGRTVREPIYSPITQNQRHLQVIRELRKAEMQNFLTKRMFDSAFDNNYKSIVVLANPKTYLNAKFAKKDVKAQVIRADQLISYIKKMDAEDKRSSSSTKEMAQLAQFFLQKSQPLKSDYSQKYMKMADTVEKTEQTQPNQEQSDSCQRNDEEKGDSGNEALAKRLKAFRLEQSRREGIKPYYIFNDLQMNDLISKKPSSKNELLKVSGFGEKKVEKYGDAILKLMNEP